MSNPEITKVQNTTLFKDKMVFVDRDVEVAGITTLKAGTVLGILTASEEDNTGAFGVFSSVATNGLQVPVAILAQGLSNSATTAQKISMVRIAVMGKLDGGNLIFARSGDTLNTLISGKKVKDVLVANGLIAEDYQELTGYDNGAE